MSDELPPDNPETTADAATATATEEEGPKKLPQTVEIKDIGPCRKHIRIAIDRAAIDERIGEKVKDLVKDSFVPGFRPGKAPRKVVEKRFASEVGDQVKNELLLVSLEQLAEDFDIAPLTAPNINPTEIELPKDGPLVYEFEVEVRPQFDLPQYKGLKLTRPTKTYTPTDVQDEKRRLLASAGQVVPKADGKAALGDILVAELAILDGDKEVNRLEEQNYRIENKLVFKDAVAEKFAEQVEGAKAGDIKTVDLMLSTSSADPALAGKQLKAQFHVKDVKTLRTPELTPEFLAASFGVDNEEQLDEMLLVMLNRRLEYMQRRSAREQVVEKIAAAAEWDLPEDLLRRQARKALQRRLMEMRADGIGEEEIQKQAKLLQQNVLQSTAVALKEHFVLQKIAEVEKIELSDDEIDDEIGRLAAQSDETPRRLRARLEREDLLDTLAAEMIERKALDLILDSAEYEDVPLDKSAGGLASDVEAVETQTVPGEMPDPTAAPPAEEAAAETTPETAN